MPLPSLLCVAFAAGIAAAIAGKVELRISPRPALLTRSFMAFLLFCVLVLIPVSVYFYAFHGDWFLLYTVDVRRVPSALALVGFGVQAALGALGFLVGASMVRNQREGLGGVLVGIALVCAGGVAGVARDRLAVVGSFAQYRGGFGLEPYAAGALLQGTIVMSAILLVGVAALLFRLRSSGRRGD